MSRDFTHEVVESRLVQGQITRKTVFEFKTFTAFGKSAGLAFREFVRTNYKDARIVNDSSLMGFHFSFNDGVTVELR